jgi:argininosuccinate lyase
MATKKLWGGRFHHGTDGTVEAFTASEHFDRRLASYDIAGSRAHALMLAAQGVISEGDCQAILEGLQTIDQEIAEGRFEWQASREDVHMNIEARLTELIGEPGKKLHTARSRNDQVATDLRLFTREALDQIKLAIADLQHALLDVAEREADTIMPGMTHMQSAQPITCGHHLLAWCAMFDRDAQRLADCRRRVNVSPLGSAALAGTSFPIDREQTAKALGFDSVCANSLDGVSDRDFVIEFCAVVALLNVHLSRVAEELVLWSSQSFGYVDLGDGFCTGSSIMPQKKNPDVAELIRGKSGRAVGHLVALLVLMKGQPLAYNRDNQEDKEPLFDSFDNAHACLQVLTGMVRQMTFNSEQMRAAAARGHSTATDLADYLVKKGMPFRDAHEAVGKAVSLAESRGVELAMLSLADLRTASDLITGDALDVLTLDGSVNARDHRGGTAPRQVRIAIQEARAALKAQGD